MKIYNWDKIEEFSLKIVDEIRASDWMPDYVVGIVGGSCIPAVLIAQELGVELETLKVELPDSVESNLWMAEDAVGCRDTEIKTEYRKNILLVLDIYQPDVVDCIREDWDTAVYGTYADIWNSNVRVASLLSHPAHADSVDYVARFFRVHDPVETTQSLPWKNFSI